MLARFTLEGFLKAIVQHQVTDLTLVPAIVNRLVSDPTVNAEDLRCVKRIACGAAPLGPEVLEQLRSKLPWTGFRQSYGMTESCCCLTTHPPEFYSYAYGHTGGTILGSTVIKVVDMGTGKELGANETGEILAKGPQIAMGYLANEKETAETFGSDGFLRTGDIGMIDGGGFIHIVDRIKEMIKVKGQQVAPAELESLLLGCVSVADCAVVGVPDSNSGERPKAYVVLKPGVEHSVEIGREILRYVRERRVRYKWIREVEFIAEIPKSPSSKILRRVLREKDRSGHKGFTVQDTPGRAKL
jgi:acyl-CoA synthetase (AMP-forming)/AMP-acid ligase II